MFRILKIIVILQIVCAITAFRELKHRHKRIIGGEVTPINSYPHQISLRFTQNDKHFCGGAILTDSWILTAAQCTQGSKSSIDNVYIVAGATNLTSGGLRVQLGAIVPHPLFKWAKRENDIAMLRTKEPMALRDNAIFPIALPSYSTDYRIESGIGLTYVTLTGWGAFEVGLLFND